MATQSPRPARGTADAGARTTRGSATTRPLEAYVLHHYDWSESSLILDLYTREQGRVTVVAKGAKRPSSQLRSVLLPFQRALVLLSRPAAGADGESREVQTLRSAEWAGGQPMLRGAALFAGFYLNELLMKLLARHDPLPLLFDAYAATLGPLASADDDVQQAALRAFELRLLHETGVLPDLARVTMTQQRLQPEQRYTLAAGEAGLRPAQPGEPAFGGAAWAALQSALDEARQLVLQQACAPVLTELKAMLRVGLHYHLGSSTLRTRQVMLEVQKLQD